MEKGRGLLPPPLFFFYMLDEGHPPLLFRKGLEFLAGLLLGVELKASVKDIIHLLVLFNVVDLIHAV